MLMSTKSGWPPGLRRLAAKWLAAAALLALVLPAGETPMVYSALEARKDFDDPRHAAVVLVTNGLDEPFAERPWKSEISLRIDTSPDLAWG